MRDLHLFLDLDFFLFFDLDFSCARSARA